jgi:uncharacterized protein
MKAVSGNMPVCNSPLAAAVFLVLTFAPFLAIWLGLYQIHNAVAAFAIYHGICLLPAIIWGRTLWRSSLLLPSGRQSLTLLVSAILFNCLAVFVYEFLGSKLLADQQILDLLNQQGFSKTGFWPLSIYSVVVNPVIEELFWRGVVFNELDRWRLPFKHFAIVWSSALYAGFHYLIFRLVLFPGWAELGILLLAVYGAILALIYEKTGSIVSTALTHGLLTDLAVIVLLLDLFRRHPGILF